MVRSDGKLLQHTAQDKKIGANVGHLPVETGRNGGPKTLQALVAAGEDWVGDFTSGDGELQVAACAYVTRLDSMVIIHTPAEDIDADVRASVLPWVGGLAFSAFLLIPLSLGLLYWAHVDSMRRRDRAVGALRESNSLYQSLVEHIPQMIFRKDLDGRATFVNQRYCELLQKPLNEILGRNDFDFHSRELAEKYRKDDLRVIETGETFEAVEEHQTVDGRKLIVRVVKTPIRDSNDRIIGVQGIFWDVTERRQTQLALRESEGRLREAQRVGQIGSFERDVHTGEVWWSDELYHLFGLEQEQFSPTTDSFTELLHPDDKVEYTAALMSWLDTGEHLKREYRAKHSSGEWRHFETIANVKFDDSGKILELCGTVQDITERKQMEESLHLSQFALDHAADPIFWIRQDGQIFYANNAACQSLGYTSDELLAMTVSEIDPDFPEENWPAHWQEMKEADRSTFESHHQTKDGRIFPVEITASHLNNGPHEFIWAYVHDITERKQSEHTLRQSAANLARAEELAMIGNWHWDIAANKITWSDQYYRIVGLDREGFAANYEAYLSCIHPDDLEYFKNTTARVLKEKSSYSAEYRIVRPNNDIRVIHERGEVGVDTNGNAVDMFGTVQDITDRRRAENLLRQRELELIHAGRLSLVGEMAASMMHEIAQPLYAIGNYAVACQRHIEQGRDGTTGKLLSCIGSISKNVARTKDILAEMGDFCRRSDPIPSTVLVNDLITDILRMLEFKTSKSRVTVEFKSERKYRVFVNGVQIQQVFANLIRNACDAFEEAAVDDARLVIRTKIRDGACQVSFEDNGPGLNPEISEQIFDSFFTTKQTGMGLGLAISRTIVEAYGGRIWVNSNLDRGVTFYITLSLSTEGEE